MDTNLHYCRAKVAPDGSNFYYAILFHPEAEQRTLLALFTFGAELQFILDTIEDPGVARIKLEWWRQELGNYHQHHPRHPITQLLSQSSVKPAELSGSLAHLVHQTEEGLQAQNMIEAMHRERMAALWRLGGLTCGCRDEAVLGLLAQAASVVERHAIDEIQSVLKLLQQQRAPLFSIILTHLAATALKKQKQKTISGKAPLPELLPIHKLWIAWRDSRQ